jgi:hypothetical protein
LCNNSLLTRIISDGVVFYLVNEGQIPGPDRPSKAGLGSHPLLSRPGLQIAPNQIKPHEVEPTRNVLLAMSNMLLSLCFPKACHAGGREFESRRSRHKTD